MNNPPRRTSCDDALRLSAHGESCYAEQVKKLENVVQQFSLDGVGGFSEARRVVTEVYQIVQGMPDEYWRGRFTEEIQTKYGKFLPPEMRKK